MPPQSTPTAASPTQEAYPRPLNRLEKQFVTHHARIAAAITFTQEPRLRAEVMKALENAMISHPAGFAQLDADGKKLDWHRGGVMPELQVSERPMPAFAVGDGNFNALPHDLVARDDQGGPIDITLLVAGADQIGGVVLNASHALLDAASLKPLVETFVRNLSREPGERAMMPMPATSPPPLLDRGTIGVLWGPGRPLPSEYLPLDPRFHPASDSDIAVRQALTVREKAAAIEAKEEASREKIMKNERKDLQYVFKSEHKDYEKMKKAEEKIHESHAATYHTSIKQLGKFEKNLGKVLKSEAANRRKIIKEQTNELTNIKRELKGESQQYANQEKMIQKQVGLSRHEQKDLLKEEKKLAQLADKKGKTMHKKEAGPKLQPHLERQQGLYRRIADELRGEREQLQQDEFELKKLAEEEGTAAAFIAQEVQNVKQRSSMAPVAAKELDKEKQRALDEARVLIHKDQADLKGHEEHYTALAKAAHDERKKHAKEHGQHLEAKLGELDKPGDAIAKVPELLFLSPKDIFGPNYNAKGGQQLSPEQQSHFLELPRSQINSIIHATGGSQDHLLAYLAAAFAVGVLSQAQAHDAIRSYLDQGGHRVGVTFAVASDLRDAKSEVDARRSNVSYPLLCTGFITAAIVFEEHELKRALGYGRVSGPESAQREPFQPAAAAAVPAPAGGLGERPVETVQVRPFAVDETFATKFDIAGIAQRFLLEIRRRIERGEAHRSALSQADGDTQIAPPQALIALTNVGLIRDAERISVELRQLSDRGASGIVEGEALSVLSWASTTEGHVHLSIDADPNSDLDSIRNIIRSARSAFGQNTPF
jgi:hypothetical protein